MSENIEMQPAKYKKGEKVLCYEPDPVKQPVVYFSSIQEVKHQDVSEYLEKLPSGSNGKAIQATYLIHFQNWGAQYDRWVTEDLILPITPESLAVKEKLDNQVLASRKRPRTQKKETPKQPSSSSSSSVELLDTKYKLKIVLPPTIKLALERDFVNVTLRNLLIRLPRSPTVEKILQQFIEHARAKGGDADGLSEFAAGISTYFDFMLPLQLLYKEERSQYGREGCVHAARTKRQHLLQERDGSHVMYPGYTKWGEAGSPGPIQPSKLYGAEHLLRLFVKLPEYMEHMEQVYLEPISRYCSTFLRYVAEHRAEVFVDVQPYKEADLCDLG